MEALLIVHVGITAKEGPLRSLLQFRVRYMFVSDTSMVEEVNNNENAVIFPLLLQ